MNHPDCPYLSSWVNNIPTGGPGVLPPGPPLETAEPFYWPALARGHPMGSLCRPRIGDAPARARRPCTVFYAVDPPSRRTCRGHRMCSGPLARPRCNPVPPGAPATDGIRAPPGDAKRNQWTTVLFCLRGRRRPRRPGSPPTGRYPRTQSWPDPVVFLMMSVPC